MTLSEYVAALKRGWWIVLATVLVAVACAFVLIVRQPDVYNASTQLFVASAAESKNPEELYQRNLIATQRVASYVTVINGDVVADRVADLLGVDDLDATVVTSVQAGTVVMVVTASGSDPQEAADVANGYAEVVPDVIAEIEQVDGGPPPVHVTVTDKADVPVHPLPTAKASRLAAAVILGLGLGLTIVVLREVLRRERATAARTAAGAGQDEGA